MIQGVIASQGGGAALYRCGAAHFDGATSLDFGAALTGLVDAAGFNVSGWINVPSRVALGGRGEIAYQFQTAAVMSFELALLADVTTCHWLGLFHSTYSGGSKELDAEADSESWPGFGTWVHFAHSVDANFAAGTKRRQLYINGVSANLSGFDGDNAFLIGYGAATDIIQIGSGLISDLADLQIRPVFVDLDVADNMACFRSLAGKPVDPAVATAAFGAAPILFSGSGPAFGLNQGVDVFTVTGGPLTVAATSPSD